MLQDVLQKKNTEEDKQEIQEATASVAAANETCSDSAVAAVYPSLALTDNSELRIILVPFA